MSSVRRKYCALVGMARDVERETVVGWSESSDGRCSQRQMATPPSKRQPFVRSAGTIPSPRLQLREDVPCG